MIKNPPVNAAGTGLTFDQEDPPDQEMAAHSSISWKIPGKTEESDRQHDSPWAAKELYRT